MMNGRSRQKLLSMGTVMGQSSDTAAQEMKTEAVKTEAGRMGGGCNQKNFENGTLTAGFQVFDRLGPVIYFLP